MGLNTRNAVFVLALVVHASFMGCTRARYRVEPILRSEGKDLETLRTTKTFREDASPFADGTSQFGIMVINPYTYNPSVAEAKRADQQQAPQSQSDQKTPDPQSGPFSLYQVAAGLPQAVVWYQQEWRQIESGSVSEFRTTDRINAIRAEARNQLQNAIIRLSDQAVSEHLASIKASESFWNTSLGFLTTSLAGAAAVTTGGLSSGLAAGATVASGTRSLINEQEFRNALVEAIVLLIDKDRASILEVLRQNQRLPIDRYDVEQAIADANAYHYRGSFVHGLTLVIEAARKSGNELEQSTLVSNRAKVELARLMGMHSDGIDRFIQFAGLKAAPEDGANGKAKAVQGWLTAATPEQVAQALAYMREQGNPDQMRAELAEATATVSQAESALQEVTKRDLELADRERAVSLAASNAEAEAQGALETVSMLSGTLTQVNAPDATEATRLAAIVAAVQLPPGSDFNTAYNNFAAKLDAANADLREKQAKHRALVTELAKIRSDRTDLQSRLSDLRNRRDRASRLRARLEQQLGEPLLAPTDTPPRASPTSTR